VELVVPVVVTMAMGMTIVIAAGGGKTQTAAPRSNHQEKSMGALDTDIRRWVALAVLAWSIWIAAALGMFLDPALQRLIYRAGAFLRDIALAFFPGLW
jgi:hypothetical protein